MKLAINQLKNKILNSVEVDGNIVEASKCVFRANSILNWYKQKGHKKMTSGQIDDIIGRILDNELDLVWQKEGSKDVPILNKKYSG